MPRAHEGVRLGEFPRVRRLRRGGRGPHEQRPGVRDLFDAVFPTWSDASSLVDLIEASWAIPRRRRGALGLRGDRAAPHTYQLRAQHSRCGGRLDAADAVSGSVSGSRAGTKPTAGAITTSPGALHAPLERVGHPTQLHFIPIGRAGRRPRRRGFHLFGLKEAPSRPGQLNLMWHISHPDLAWAALYERYDHVFVASDRFAARMASKFTRRSLPSTRRPTPSDFSLDPEGRATAPFRRQFTTRQATDVDDLAGTTTNAIYGRGWTPDLSIDATSRASDPEHVLAATTARQ